MKFSKRKLRLFLETESADSEINNKPLLFWSLDQPKIVKLLLESGANANIEIEIYKGLIVTPISVCKVILRQLKKTVNMSENYGLINVCTSVRDTMENIQASMKLLTRFNGVSGQYRNYISLNIRKSD
jgi:hypothetical protein